MDRICDPDRARRLARVLISDIVAYASDQVRLGLEKDDIFERLRPELERARAYYDQRVDRELPDAARYFDFAVVDVLIAANRRVATHIW